MEAGIKGHYEFTVTEEQLAVNVGSGIVRVLATPMMVAAIEKTASESVAPRLAEGSTTVGTKIDVTHCAATPAGMKVHVETELTAVSPNGRGLTFHVAAYDEKGLIGEGTHERVVVYKDRFEQKAEAKKNA